MKRAALFLALFASAFLLSASCGKQVQNNQQVQEQASRDILAGTVWSAPGGGSSFRYLHFLAGGRAKITFSDNSKVFEGAYKINGGGITFSIGWEMLVYSNGLTHSITYTFQTGELQGDAITVRGVIRSTTALDGQEFVDIYTKIENE